MHGLHDHHLPESTAIACASGSFKGVFTHGVLSAFAGAGFRAAAYAAASSTVIPAAYAATGALNRLDGVNYWHQGAAYLRELGGMSEMVLAGIEELAPYLQEKLFEPGMPRFLISTSAVLTRQAARLTQGSGARRLGQKLLLATRNRDRNWAAEHLAHHLFDTEASGDLRLTPGNLDEVIYASTRMLHAWRTPAEIDGRPYVDASYTCACPAVGVAGRGYGAVIAISPEPGPLYRDLFASATIPSQWQGVPISVIQPEMDLAEIGVNYNQATADGIDAAFAYGVERGEAWLAAHSG